MKHFLTIGHLDEAAVRSARAVARGPRLPDPVVTELLARFRDPDTDPLTFEGTPVEVTDGWVRCTWYAPRRIARAVSFAAALQEATGCVVADVAHGRLVDRAELLRR